MFLEVLHESIHDDRFKLLLTDALFKRQALLTQLYEIRDIVSDFEKTARVHDS